jgi:hypothetical protein
MHLSTEEEEGAKDLEKNQTNNRIKEPSYIDSLFNIHPLQFLL